MLRRVDLPTSAAAVDDRQTGPETLRDVNVRPSDRLKVSYI
jgi:hypothetical protein